MRFTSGIAHEPSRQTGTPAGVPAPGRPTVPQDRVLSALHWASLGVAVAVLLYANRMQWFFGDEFDFLGHRGLIGAERSIWEPHSEHWSTVPILVYRAIFSVVGLKSYLPYVVAMLVFHVIVAHLLWIIMSRAGVDRLVATLLSAVFAVLGAGYENLLWAFQVGFIGSVALGLGLLLVVDHDGPFGRRDVLGWALATFSLTFSGISVTMIALAGLAVLLRRGVRTALAVVSVPAFAYLVWLQMAGRKGLQSHPRSLDNFFSYPSYVWTGLRAAFDAALFPGSGAVAVLALGLWLLRRNDRVRAGGAAPVAMALSAVLLFTLLAVGRSELGVEQAGASRYTYIAVALLLPVIGLVLTELIRESRANRIAVVFLLGMVAINNLALLRAQARREGELDGSTRRQVVAAAELAVSGAPIVARRLEPIYNHDLTVPVLQYFKRESKLPHVSLSALDHLGAMSALQVDVDDAPLANAVPARMVAIGRAGEVGPARCRRFVADGPFPQIELQPLGPTTLELRSDSGGAIKVYLKPPGFDFPSPPRDGQVAPGRPSFVNVVADVTTFVLELPPGRTEICGIAPDRPTGAS